MHRLRLAVTGLLVALGASIVCGCGSTADTNASGSWVDDAVTFNAGGITVHGTYRHPGPGGQPVPAALLIAGSGATDRNGDSPALGGSVGTLQSIADELSGDGVASLRYDKLGSGQTGLGSYAAHPETIGMAPYEQEAAAALAFLAGRPDVIPSRLAVIGHSEGALFALQLATRSIAGAPAVRAVALLEPLSLRYLDLIRDQIDAQVMAAQRAGSLTQAAATAGEAQLNAAITSLRTKGTVPPGLPKGLAAVLNPTTALFLHEADAIDPAQLARRLPAAYPALASCSDADVQVTCVEVGRVVSELRAAKATTDFVRLTGVDHVLKDDTSRSPASYTASLPFSEDLQQALDDFVAQHL